MTPTTLDQATYRGFACPDEPLDLDFTRELAGEFARAFAGLFLEQFGTELERRGGGVVALLERWRASAAVFDEDWDAAVGSLRTAVLGRGPGALRSAAAAALQLAAQGRPGEWSLYLPEPARLRFGEWRLPLADELTCRGDARRCELSLTTADGTARAVRFERDGGGWTSPDAERLARFACGEHAVRVVEREDLDEFGRRDRADALAPLAPAAVGAACEQALELVREHAPAWGPWIERVLRGVVPLDGADGTLRSSGDDDRPGIVEISFPHGAAAIAEMLVHETSHQHFYLLTRLGEVDDGTDTELYHSPVKREGRPIRAILLAYHAFANVALFYRACLASGVDDGGYCRRNLERHLPELEVLERHLRATDALTDVGRALWEPLVSRLR